MDTEKRLFDCLEYQLQKFPQPDMLVEKVNGKWVSHSTSETKEKVNTFLKKTNISFRIIPGIGDYFKILHSNFPQTIFVNREGIITDIQNGMTPIYDKLLKKTSDKMEEAEFINSLNAIK